MTFSKATGSILVLGLLAACGSSSESQPDPGAAPAAPAAEAPKEATEIGKGDHTAGSVTLTPIATKVEEPTSIAFNPDAPNELWITSRSASALVVYDVSGEKLDTFEDDSAHFLDKPIALAFSDNGTLATCQASRDERGGTKGDDHMGPTAFPASRDKLRSSIAGAHLDMVHHTPLCAGIVSVGGSEYWILNGLVGSLDRYDFGEFHPPGAEDHADSKTWRFLKGTFKRDANVPSQMVYDAASKAIFIADAGNARIVKVDVSAPTEGKVITPGNMMDGPLVAGDGVEATEIVGAGGESGITAPSGLALYKGLLYVSDSATGIVSAFKLDGTRVNYLETGLAEGALAGIAFGEDGKLYLADRVDNQVLRVDP